MNTNYAAPGVRRRYSFAAGTTGTSYGFNFATDGRVRAAVFIGRGNTAFNKRVFDALAKDKAAMNPTSR